MLSCPVLRVREGASSTSRPPDRAGLCASEGCQGVSVPKHFQLHQGIATGTLRAGFSAGGCRHDSCRRMALGPPVPFLPVCFLGEGSRTKIDESEKSIGHPCSDRAAWTRGRERIAVRRAWTPGAFTVMTWGRNLVEACVRVKSGESPLTS